MELSLTSHDKNIFPIGGFFIEDPNLESWINTLDEFNIDVGDVELHPIPSHIANELWGCLVLIHDQALMPDDLGRLQGAQVYHNLIIPEKSRIIPELQDYDYEQLFQSERHVLHVDFGLYKLSKPLAIEDFINIGTITEIENTRPKRYDLISPSIHSFRIEASQKEDLELEIESSVNREKLQNEPLSFQEKIRLNSYKKYLVNDEKDTPELNSKGKIIDRISKLFSKSGDQSNNILDDYKNLEERNKREVDKLLDLMKNNPEDALKYAIPLEEHGYSRGKGNASFKMQERGLDLSLFRKNYGKGYTSGNVDLGEEYFKLRIQYQNSAYELRNRGEYEKAAYIYFKLLKNYNSAAETLKEGKKYEKAAMIYKDYVKSEQKAAECYEKGKIYHEAIKLYNNLNQDEKVGDIYIKLGDRPSANKSYQKQIDKDIQSRRPVKAATISKDKMHNLSYAQEILLNGWNNKIDSFNCLSKYFANITDTKEVWKAITRVHKENNTVRNEKTFLKVLKGEYENEDENQEKIQNLAYQIISKRLEEGTISPSELISFNKKNSRLRADTIRYEMNKNKRL